MDKKKLDNFTKATKGLIDQPLEGLLYDLDLLPEQLKYELDGKRYSVVVNMYEEIKALEERLSEAVGGIAAK